MAGTALEDIGPEGVAQEGYCLLRGAIPAHRIAKLAVFCRDGAAASRLNAAQQALPARLEPAIIGVVHGIQGEMPLPLTAGFFPVAPSRAPDADGLPLHPHTLSLELVTEPSGGFVFVWLALQDIGLDSEPVWIVPRSHHQLQALQRNFANRPAEGDLHRLLSPYHNALHRILTAELARIVPVLIQAGDALVFDTALLHCAMPPNVRDDGAKSLRLAYARATFAAPKPFMRTRPGSLKLFQTRRINFLNLSCKPHPTKRTRATRVDRCAL